MKEKSFIKVTHNGQKGIPKVHASGLYNYCPHTWHITVKAGNTVIWITACEIPLKHCMIFQMLMIMSTGTEFHWHFTVYK